MPQLALRLILCVVMLTVPAQVSAVAQGRLLIHAGGDRDFPPYEFLQDGKPTGFNIDLMYALAEAMNFDVEIHLGPWNQVMGDLREKRLDVLTGMAYSEERSDDFDFSIPHTMILPALFVRRDSNIQTLTRRKVEKALQKSEAEYRAIVDAFDGQIYVCSADYRIEFMNAQLIKRTGRDATGELCYRVLHNREEVCPWCVNERVLAGESVRWEVQSPKDNRWYYIVNTPISREEGIVAKQAVILDVTDRVEAEEEMKNLEEKNRQLKKAESLGRMAAAIAHHFNNKLHVVIGCLEAMQLSSSTVQNPGGSSLVLARQAAEQAAEVSRLMLAYLGQIPGRRESLDLSEVGKLYLSRAGDFLPRNITLKTHFAEPGPAIKANAGQLQVLLSHLVTNATEAIGSEPGTITVNVGTVLQGDIATANVFPLHWQPTEERYGCLEIGDDGSGM